MEDTTGTKSHPEEKEEKGQMEKGEKGGQPSGKEPEEGGMGEAGGGMDYGTEEEEKGGQM